jgi:hypothetical protein
MYLGKIRTFGLACGLAKAPYWVTVIRALLSSQIIPSLAKALLVWGEVWMCGYLPHINRLFVVYALVVRWNTMDSELHAMVAVVPLARSFFLGPGVTGACDVSVMPPSPLLPEFRAWALARSLEARPPPCGRIDN